MELFIAHLDLKIAQDRDLCENLFLRRTFPEEKQSERFKKLKDTQTRFLMKPCKINRSLQVFIQGAKIEAVLEVLP